MAIKANETFPEWAPEIAAERIDMCRAVLHIHGFLSDSEDARVNKRIEKWAEKDGVRRHPRRRPADKHGGLTECDMHEDESY
jgi:hypothetical protein